MISILVVEDDDSVVEDLRQFLPEDSFELVVAEDRDAALAALSNQRLGFILCDLKIPARAGDLITSELYGFAVHQKWMETCPGIPMIIFSGFATLQNTRDRTSSSPPADIFFGDLPIYPMLQVRDKSEMLSCVADVQAWASRTGQALRDISITTSAPLSPAESLAVACFGRHRSAASVNVRPTSTKGLSGSATFLATYLDRRDVPISRAFVKIGPREKILDEVSRFAKHVPGVLPIGTFAPYLSHLQYGLGHVAAIFYDIAEAYPTSLFSLVKDDDSAAAEAVTAVKVATGQWRLSQEEETFTLGQLRRRLIPDAKFLPRSEFEAGLIAKESTPITTTFCRQHGDLHGENVLLSAVGTPVLIDFGDVGLAPRMADPVALELSLKFNRDSPYRNHAWPTTTQAQAWWRLDEYLVGCPCPEFVRACREWAFEDALLAEVAAMVYAQSSRQLRYEPEFYDLARAYARGAISLV